MNTSCSGGSNTSFGVPGKGVVTESWPTLCDPVDYSSSGSSVHGILQAKILEVVAMPFSRGSSWPRDWTQVSGIAGRFFTIWATREAPHVLITYHGFNSMSILIPTSQFFSHDSCSWGMRIFHLTGITVKWFYMTVIDFLIVFVGPILLGTSAVLGIFFFLNIYPGKNEQIWFNFCC